MCRISHASKEAILLSKEIKNKEKLQIDYSIFNISKGLALDGEGMVLRRPFFSVVSVLG